ncbi:uncharacterized protein LOC121370143 [Gigantopelta aegis]|uniref:uncharacterized protein LOC121370143 n=1 Tax=Gigantopelta aegis TaxID=1735272 RepID=UPI001B889755|nr:uncharacterized protein LOC121370143 [Gigantopelta aegis]
MVVTLLTLHQRLRCYSEGEDYPDEQEQSGPLPDIICNIRDRSVSLPDVQALRRQREVEVGRELRRISDEFHFRYHRRRFLPAVQENFDGEASSFPGARRPSINKMMDSLKMFFRRGAGGDPDMEDPSEPT